MRTLTVPKNNLRSKSQSGAAWLQTRGKAKAGAAVRDCGMLATGIAGLDTLDLRGDLINRLSDSINVMQSIAQKSIIGDATESLGAFVFNGKGRIVLLPSDPSSDVEKPVSSGAASRDSVARNTMQCAQTIRAFVRLGEAAMSEKPQRRSFLERVQDEKGIFFAPEVLYLRFYEDIQLFALSEHGGDIVSPDDWFEMREALDAFYSQHTSEEVDEINAARAASAKEDYDREKEQARAEYRANKKRRNRKPGYVYLIKGENGQYKIGRAKNLKTRFEHFGLILPFATEILHTIPSDDYILAEKLLHEKYADKRGRGEWFTLDDVDIAEICALTRFDPE